ncbi:hypothetical protein CMV_017812 [Castanea mollissima]|uniref:Uncharacterized protein n=1 Tax=Castanea mollissima TaxID=60419 RepID=A0A8J4QSH4_9ROSI|nr:hypothetical protein CMV_017812 [Castanea mollissima]
MLSKSIDQYPQSTVQKPDEPEKASEELEAHPNSEQNGVEPRVGDGDEVMTDVEADIDDEMTIDMEAFEEIVGSLEKKNRTNCKFIVLGDYFRSIECLNFYRANGSISLEFWISKWARLAQCILLLGLVNFMIALRKG